MLSAICTAALLFALLVASSATGSTPNASVVIKWTLPVPNGARVAWVTQDIAFFSFETQTAGEYNNTVQAATANQSSLWTMSSLGHFQSYTTAYAFPVIPKLIFLLVNNIQPPNVSAVIPFTGFVVWSTAGVFAAARGALTTLVSSVDGTTLYLFTPSPGGTMQLTAFDSGSGEVLFAQSEPLPLFQPLQCGSFGSGCYVNWLDNAQAVFLDGRTDAFLAGVSLPTSINVFTFVSESLVLANAGTALYMINTTNYTLAWSRDISNVTAVWVLTMPAGSTTNMALLLANTGGFRAVDAATGQEMWDSTAKAICPFARPAPGYAESLYTGEYQVVQPQPGGELLIFTVTCTYPGEVSMYVFGRMNATDGAVTVRRYVSYFSPPTPVGSSYFMQQHWAPGESQTEYFVDSTNMTLVGWWPPESECGGAHDFTATVQGADVIFIVQCDGNMQQQVSAVTIVD